MSKAEERAWRDYSERFRREVLPKILSSAVFMSIGTETDVFDVQMATQLGAALMADKPLLLVCPKGRQVGIRLRRAADVIIDDWDAADPDAQERIADAMQRMGL
jgi:hypothetical protein